VGSFLEQAPGGYPFSIAELSVKMDLFRKIGEEAGKNKAKSKA
jgi:hypothetical protein